MCQDVVPGIDVKRATHDEGETEKLPAHPAADGHSVSLERVKLCSARMIVAPERDMLLWEALGDFAWSAAEGEED